MREFPTPEPPDPEKLRQLEWQRLQERQMVLMEKQTAALMSIADSLAKLSFYLTNQ